MPIWSGDRSPYESSQPVHGEAADGSTGITPVELFQPPHAAAATGGLFERSQSPRAGASAGLPDGSDPGRGDDQANESWVVSGFNVWAEFFAADAAGGGGEVPFGLENSSTFGQKPSNYMSSSQSNFVNNQFGTPRFVAGGSDLAQQDENA
jgi:hypothetical protein